MSADLPEERTLIYWVNSLRAHHCLLADKYEDLLNGCAVWEILELFESDLKETESKNPERSLQDAIDWIGKKYGWTALPPFLSRAHAAEMISLGEYRGMRDLLRFLNRKYGREEERTRVAGRGDDEAMSIDDLNSGAAFTQSMPAQRYRSVGSMSPKRTIRIGPFQTTTSRGATRRRNDRRSAWTRSVTTRRTRPQRRLRTRLVDEKRAAPPLPASSVYVVRPRRSTRRRQQRRRRRPPSGRPRTSFGEKHVDSKGVFRMSTMIDPTYVSKDRRRSTRKKKRGVDSHRYGSRFATPPPRSLEPPPPIAYPRSVHSMDLRTLRSWESTLEWVRSIGLRRWSELRLDEARNVTDVGIAFRDGLLLCDLVDRLLGRDLMPPALEPETTLDRLRNVNTALKALRAQPNFLHSRWLWSAEAIEEAANPTALLGLLTDMRGWYHRENDVDDEADTTTAVHGRHLRTSSRRSARIDREELRELLPLSARPTDYEARMERVIRWLRSLGVECRGLAGCGDESPSSPRSKGTLSRPQRNPARDGILWCDLTSVLCPYASLSPPYRRPRDESEAATNISRALLAFRRSGLLRLGASVADVAREVVRGECDSQGAGGGRDGLAFEILDALRYASSAGRRIAEEAEEEATEESSSTPRRIERKTQDADDADVVAWLASLGLVSSAQTTPTLEALVRGPLADGTLFCKLVSVCCGREVKPFAKGAVESETSVVENFLAALKCLRHESRANRRHIVPEEGVAQLLRASSMRSWRLILRDLYKLHERSYPRVVESFRSGDDANAAVAGDGEEEKAAMSAYARDAFEEEEEEEAGEIVTNEDVETARSALDAMTLDEIATSQRAAFSPKKSPSRGSTTKSGRMRSSANDVDNVEEEEEDDDDDDRFATVSDRGSVAEEYAVAHGPTSGVSRVVGTWLSDLGIDAVCDVSGSILQEFRDGLILCQIVELLDPTLRRGGIRGVEKNPKSGAARLHNIRVALRVLRKHKTMPLDFLWSELQIRAGDGDTIRGLLMHMRKAYGHHLRHRKNRGMGSTTVRSSTRMKDRGG